MQQAGFPGIFQIVVNRFGRNGTLLAFQELDQILRRKGIPDIFDKVGDWHPQQRNVAHLVTVGYILQNDGIKNVVQILFSL